MPNSSTDEGALLREFARLFIRAQHTVANCCELTNTQCHVLTELERAGPLSQSVLGGRLGLEKSWVSRAIDSMVSSGLVVKKPNPEDGRSWRVSLTAKGRRSVNELNSELNAHAARLFTAISGTERSALKASLPPLLAVLRKDAGIAVSNGSDKRK